VPFNPLRHPYSFRWFHDYSGGKVTDWGAHHNDIVQWGFGTDGSGPVAVEGRATYPERGPFDTPVEFEAVYEYADGRTGICRSEGRGVKFVGTEGWVHVDRGFLEADPPSLLGDAPGRDEVRLETSLDHHANWLDCIRSRQRPICDVAVGAGSVIVCHLVNLALRTGRRLRWDPGAGRFLGDDFAERRKGRPYRAPWRP
jgi:predicted dehydrogenase